MTAKRHDAAATSTQLDPTRWVERYGDSLFRHALLRIGDRHVAEELVQECFVAALQARAGFRGDSSERTWLVGILKHKLTDHIRAQSRRRQLEVNPADDVASGDFDERGYWARAPKEWTGDPQAAMQNEAFRSVLSGCVRGLPEKLAAAFVLREVDGVASDEVCGLLEITSANLWKRLHRARLALRRCLENNWFQQ